MKRLALRVASAVLLLVLALSLAACGDVDSEELWNEALYGEDAELGSGAKTVEVEVVAGDRSVTFTIHTDEEFLDKALIAHGLVEGEDGPFGLYVKRVNGILADYDVNQSYWALTVGGETSMNGVSETLATDGEHYELIYSK